MKSNEKESTTTTMTQTQTFNPPKTICVDFDGSLCDFAFPNIGAPKAGAKAALTLFRQLGYRIIIWSCRCSHWHYDIYGGDPTEPTLKRDRVKEMIKFLEENEIPYDEIDDGSRGKPTANYYLDDRAVRIDDNWAEIAAFIYDRDSKGIL